MDTQGLADRIRQERERAGLSQEELGVGAEIDRTAISKIESGVRKVSALELARIADAVGVRMARLVEEPLPAIVSHRSNQGLDTSDSKVDMLLEAFAHDVELVQSLAPTLADSAASLEIDFCVPKNSAQPETLAASARDALGLSASDPVKRLQDEVARVGLWTLSQDFGPDTADAGSMLLRHGGVALVNSHNKVGRRRLALAHELGHYLLRDEYSVDWRISDSAGEVEARIDRFARAFLVPKVGLTKLWTERLPNLGLRDAAVVTASEYQVDMSTLARRLQDLGLEGDTHQVRSIQTVGADIVEHGLVVPTDLEGVSLPEEFMRAILRLYRSRKVSLERTLELLRGTLTEKDLPRRPLRNEGERWNFLG